MDCIKQKIKNNYTDIALIIFIGAIIAVFMKDIYSYGVHFDEVNRSNPVFAIVNKNAYPNNQAIWSINLYGKEIPIMYKEYISSFRILNLLPIAFFSNSFVAARTWYVVCFVAEILLLYFYLKRFNKYLALSVSVLVMLNPFLYPDFNYGFSYLVHFFFLLIGAFFFEKYFKTNKNKYLFLGVFVICFGASFSFYFIWCIVGLVASSLLLNFDIWKKIICNIKSLLIAFVGAVFGLFPFVIYNLANGFPTVKVFIKNIFKHDEFNMDNIHEDSFLEGLIKTFDRVDMLLNYKLGVYVFIFALTIIIWTVLAVLKKKNKIEISKFYFYPVLVLFFTVVSIIISPKPRFPYHWLHIAPVYELAFVLGLYYILKYAIKKYYKHIITTVVIILAMFNASNSYEKTVNRTIPVDAYNISTAMFDINDYLNENDVSSEEILMLEWGIEAPLYFLNRGEIADVNGKLYYSLMNIDVESAEVLILKAILNYDSECIYIPLYNANNEGLGYIRVREALFNVLEEYNFDYETINYYDNSGNVNNMDLIILKNVKDSLFSDSKKYIEDFEQIQTIEGLSMNIEAISYENYGQVLQGWLFVEGVSISKIYMCDDEGKIIGTAQYGMQRADVQAVFGFEEALYSGYTFIVEDYNELVIVIEDENGCRYIPIN